MEEAWELAVVSMISSEVDLEVVDDFETPLLLEDFSSQVYSVQTKFFTVAMLTIFICFFDLKSESSFLGVQIADLNERIIEIGLVAVTSSLFGLLMLRISEERDVFLKLDKQLEKISSAAESQVKKIETMHANIVRNFENSPLLNGQVLEKIEMANVNADLKAKSIEKKLSQMSAEAFVQPLHGKAKMSFTLLASEVSNSTQEAAKHLVTNSSKLDELVRDFQMNSNAFVNLHLSLVGKKSFSSKRKTRIIVFDYILPVLVMMVVAVSFFWQGAAEKISNLIGA